MSTFYFKKSFYLEKYCLTLPIVGNEKFFLSLLRQKTHKYAKFVYLINAKSITKRY